MAVTDAHGPPHAPVDTPGASLPAAPLRAHVLAYLDLASGDGRDASHLVVPRLRFSAHHRPSLVAIWDGTPVAEALPAGHGDFAPLNLVAPTTRWFDVTVHGTLRALSVQFTARGARTLLGLPPLGVVDRAMPLADLLAGPVRRALADWVDALAAAPSFGARVAITDRVLSELLRRRPSSVLSVPDPVGWVIDEVERRHGAVRIATLADAVGLPERTLRRRVRQELGMSLRHCARVVRARHAMAVLEAMPVPPRPQLDRPATARLARLAVQLGYCDQAHLTREFRALVGSTPAGFASDVRPHDPAVVHRRGG